MYSSIVSITLHFPASSEGDLYALVLLLSGQPRHWQHHLSCAWRGLWLGGRHIHQGSLGAQEEANTTSVLLIHSNMFMLCDSQAVPL